MSSVFYKFKIVKDYDTCKFDGTGISVFDLKRDIMITKKLGKGTDFDLVLWNTSSGEEIVDDNEVIPKNSSVLVSRRPAQRAGKGTAQKYLGVNPMGFSKNVPTFSKVQPIAYRPKLRPNLAQNANMSEEDKIKMMFQQQSAQWENTANGARPMYRPMGMGRGMPVQQDKTPHANYVCFRCGEKGHFINQCPTLGNKDYDNRPKLKRTTGIPKMFLKTVENTDGSGLMVTTTGEIVVAQPNEDAWNKMTRSKAVGELDSFSSDLKCSLCDKLFTDAVLVSCCNVAFCKECNLDNN
jgi:protein MPE1